MKIKYMIFVFLGSLSSRVFPGELPSPQKTPERSTPKINELRSAVILIGIAKIDEHQFVYLLDQQSGQAIEATTGKPNASGLELVEVVETSNGLGGRVRLRHHGAEWWLSFAGAPAVAAANPIPKAGAPHPDPASIKRPAARNPGTFSNDPKSVRPSIHHRTTKGN